MKFVSILLISVFPLVAFAGEKEEEAYDILEKYCFAPRLNPEAIASLLSEGGAKKLPKEEAQLRLGQPGDVWSLKTKLTGYLINAEPGVCTVVHHNLDFLQMTSVAEERLKIKDEILGENEIVSVSTFKFTLAEGQKAASKVIFEISTLKVTANRNMTSMSVVLESMYDKMLREVKPPARCPYSKADQAVCS